MYVANDGQQNGNQAAPTNNFDLGQIGTLAQESNRGRSATNTNTNVQNLQGNYDQQTNFSNINVQIELTADEADQKQEEQKFDAGQIQKKDSSTL